MKAAIAAAIAAGGVSLSGDMLHQAILAVAAPREVKATLHVIGAHVNHETKFAFPSFNRLAGGCSVHRRTAVDRVHKVRALDLERNGVVVVVEPRWKSTMREDEKGDRVRAHRYRIFFRPDIAAKAGHRTQGVQPSEAGACADPEREELGGADWSAPDDSAPRECSETPQKGPACPERAPAGAAAGAPSKVPPPPSGGPCRPETDDERAVREAMLAHPETADFVGSERKWLGLAAQRQKSLAAALAALSQAADKSLPDEPRGTRWSRAVSFLTTVKEEPPRLSRAARRQAEDEERRDKARRTAEDEEAARVALAELRRKGLVGTGAQPRPAGPSLADKARLDRERLAEWARENEPP